MAPRRLAQLVLFTAAGLASAVAWARPPARSSVAGGSRVDGAREQAGPALVGRVRLRGGVVDLSRASIAEGGPAHGLAPGLAGVIADAPAARRETQDQPPNAQRVDRPGVRP